MVRSWNQPPAACTVILACVLGCGIPGSFWSSEDAPCSTAATDSIHLHQRFSCDNWGFGEIEPEPACRCYLICSAPSVFTLCLLSLPWVSLTLVSTSLSVPPSLAVVLFLGLSGSISVLMISIRDFLSPWFCITPSSQWLLPNSGRLWPPWLAGSGAVCGWGAPDCCHVEQGFPTHAPPGSLPPSSLPANITLQLKEGKLPDQCFSYSPVSGLHGESHSSPCQKLELGRGWGRGSGLLGERGGILAATLSGFTGSEHPKGCLESTPGSPFPVHV